MSVQILDNRWSVSDSQFAARVTIPDLSGFFAMLPIVGKAPSDRTLIIEPGTLAVIIDDGFLVGQITAGSYTLESLTQRLQFWKSKDSSGRFWDVGRAIRISCVQGGHNFPSEDP